MLEFEQDFYIGSFDIDTPNKEIDTLFSEILKEREEQTSGYYALPFENRALQDCEEFIQSRKKVLKKLKNLVVIGIGGSSLGLKAVDCLLRYKPLKKDTQQNITFRRPNIIFLEHTDALEIPHSLKNCKLKNTLFIAISKSGTTIETSSLLKYVIDRFGLLDSKKAKKHLAIITDTNSALEHFAKDENIACITIAPSVGGRFSVLSAIGILPLTLLGYDTCALLQGAQKFMELFFTRKEEHILYKALFLAKNHTKYPMTVLFSYSSIFKEFNAWFVQLWGESLGKIDKQGNNVGLSPIGLIGSIDQHSFLQLIVQGCADKSVSFLSLAPDSMPKDTPMIPQLSLTHLQSTDFVNGTKFAELLDKQRCATLKTLQAQNIPVDSIELQYLDEMSVGELIAYFELLTSATGCALQINTYDQPGVEFGKKRLRKMFK